MQAFVDQSVKTPTLKTQQKIFLPLSPQGDETHGIRDTTRLATPQLLFCDNFTRLAAAADPLAAALRLSTSKEPTTSKEQPP